MEIVVWETYLCPNRHYAQVCIIEPGLNNVNNITWTNKPAEKDVSENT